MHRQAGAHARSAGEHACGAEGSRYISHTKRQSGQQSAGPCQHGGDVISRVAQGGRCGETESGSWSCNGCQGVASSRLQATQEPLLSRLHRVGLKRVEPVTVHFSTVLRYLDSLTCWDPHPRVECATSCFWLVIRDWQCHLSARFRFGHGRGRSPWCLCSQCPYHLPFLHRVGTKGLGTVMLIEPV